MYILRGDIAFYDQKVKVFKEFLFRRWISKTKADFVPLKEYSFVFFDIFCVKKYINWWQCLYLNVRIHSAHYFTWYSIMPRSYPGHKSDIVY